MNLLQLHSRNIKNKHCCSAPDAYQENSGFTMIELLVSLLMVGILAAIMAPSWSGFVQRQRLNKALDGVLSAMQQAQTEAKNKKLTYSASFKVIDDIPKYAVYQGTTAPSDDSWKRLATDLSENQVLLYTNLTEDYNTTVTGKSISTTPASGTITFDYMGALKSPTTATNNGNLDLIVMVAIPNAGTTTASGSKRCIIVRTLIGGTQTATGANCKPST
ncbi:pilus assembly FimT family protein [Anabaena catenula]|uniref:Prepilin-type N-terminal cleavage/methylation domain-containing protein n=1 Tax=Anabaena catenula FACHB-362 TaxID=2692877 RepID=A0ABR8J6H2_9NOST|nr:prepilin-type N-terminal cleavage/methylation domain-containing protein [Anabaena catenula]MBD2693195.1 prepilin-type N-terminal cleavage/methylation domain-containing protein [Anabaena catenula FACHB-362]